VERVDVTTNGLTQIGNRGAVTGSLCCPDPPLFKLHGTLEVWVLFGNARDDRFVMEPHEHAVVDSDVWACGQCTYEARPHDAIGKPRGRIVRIDPGNLSRRLLRRDTALWRRHLTVDFRFLVG